MEYNFCPFCAEETTDDLDVHGQNCSEYQESLATNNCPFCKCLIGGCWVEQHSNYRKAMKSKTKPIEYPQKIEENIDSTNPKKRAPSVPRTDENLWEQILGYKQENSFEANFTQADLDFVLL